MPKLIIIAVGLAFALIGYKRAWYPTWAFLFNILISIYTSIMIVPQIIDKVSSISLYLGNFSHSVLLLISAVIIFAVMHFLSFKLFISGYVISFPTILNTVGSAFLGFLTGSVIAGFLLFLISITPALADNPAIKSATQVDHTTKRVNTVVLAACNFVHNISLQPCPTAVDKQMEKILTDWNKPVSPADTNAIFNILPVEPQSAE